MADPAGASRPSAPPEGLQLALAQARASFLSRLEPTIYAVEALSARLATPAAAPAALRELFDIVHRMHGLAATVGFSALGGAAADLDLRLARLLAGRETPAGEIERLPADLERLMDLMEDAVVDG